MTPKQKYDTRKAEREKLAQMDYAVQQRTEAVMVLDMLDRFVVAAERIADALEKTK